MIALNANSPHGNYDEVRQQMCFKNILYIAIHALGECSLQVTLITARV